PRRYLPSALAGALLALAGFTVAYWIGAVRAAPLAQDSTVYYVAAKIGLDHGWDRIYDLALQAQTLAGLHPGIADPSFFLFANPPPLAWLFTPLTLVPPLAAYLVVAALSLAALMGAAALTVSSGGWRIRIVFVLGALAWYPVVYSLRLGQVTLIVAALVVWSWWLDRRGWPEAAGAILALAVIKPQLVLLVAPCLLIAGRYRLVLSWLIVTLILGVGSLLSLGASGVQQYLHLLSIVRAATYNHQFTLAAIGVGSWLTVVLQGLAAALTLMIAHRIRGQSTAAVVAVALFGGMLAAPYLHVDDFAVLAAAAWLLLSEASPLATRLWLLPTAVTIELAWVLGPLPILASLTISLLLFWFPRPRSRSVALAA
ncbi:MAG TPA: glycosyltransferase family 87 protein, partial [Candidatus Dormibacteraeota bacterium]